MKYIKSNNQFITKSTIHYLEYEIGDYVLVSAENFKDKNPRYGKIIDTDESYTLKKLYLILLTKDQGGDDVWVTEIDRKLTDEEKYNYEVELDANKFNL